MAIPTIRFNGCVIVTLITEFLLAGVTFHTAILQTPDILELTSFGFVVPKAAGTNNIVPPFIEHNHVGAPHVLC